MLHGIEFSSKCRLFGNGKSSFPRLAFNHSGFASAYCWLSDKAFIIQSCQIKCTKQLIVSRSSFPKWKTKVVGHLSLETFQNVKTVGVKLLCVQYAQETACFPEFDARVELTHQKLNMQIQCKLTYHTISCKFSKAWTFLPNNVPMNRLSGHLPCAWNTIQRDLLPLFTELNSPSYLPLTFKKLCALIS